VISKAMQFASKREDDVRRALENVSAMVRSEYGDVLDRPLAGFQDDWPDVEAALERTRAALKEVANLELFEPAEISKYAWVSAQARLTHWISAGEVWDPDLFELLAAARRTGPTELLEFDPRQMTLQQWTRALVLGRKGLPNALDPFLTSGAGITLHAWHALGFRATADAQLSVFAEWAGFPAYFAQRYPPDLPNWPEELRKLHSAVYEQNVLLNQVVPYTTLIMIRRTNSPLTAPWRPVPDVATLLVTSDELVALTAVGSPMFGTLQLPPTSTQVCAVEMEPELATHLYSTQLPLIRSLVEQAVLAYVYPADRGREMKSPNVVAPTDPMQVVNEALRASVRLMSATTV
jgi:hypothetical protein